MCKIYQKAIYWISSHKEQGVPLLPPTKAFHLLQP